MVREFHAFTSKAVDMRGQEFRLPIAGEIAVACIIEQDVNNVRFCYGGGCRYSEGQAGKQKAGKSSLHGVYIYDRAGSFIQRVFRQATKGCGLHGGFYETPFYNGAGN